MEKWFIRNRGADLDKISREFNIPKFTAKLLVNRGINDYRLIDSYLNPSIDRLHSPKEFKDMDRALDLLKTIRDRQEKIRIVGDYDVDGVMSSYILKKAFEELSIEADYMIPDRVNDGYGINKRIIRDSYDEGIRNIITCDNGIAALDEIDYAKELGMTILVTDHHDLPFEEVEAKREEILVGADAVVNPKRSDCSYPFDRICGAGIAYKLVEGLYEYLGHGRQAAHKFLEFAAIATICDVVDLVDENRIIVTEGLKLLNKTENIGLKALIEASNLTAGEISVYHVGFVLGPSINASGRLDTAKKALDLFLTEDEGLAQELARELKELNDERKEMTERGTENIIERVNTSSLKEDTVLLVYEPDIHESVAGIIAGRVKDNFHKPTIVLTRAKEGVKGSARSIEGYNIFEELTRRKKYLSKFGGHPMAAGLSLKEEYIEDLRRDLNDNQLTREDLMPRVYIDLPLDLDSINYGLIEEVNRLEPFGKGNSRPVFACKNIGISFAKILGKNKNVLKLNLITESRSFIEGMIFNDLSRFEDLIRGAYGQEELENLYSGLDNKIRLDLVYYPSINEFMGRTTLQAIIQSYRISK